MEDLVLCLRQMITTKTEREKEKANWRRIRRYLVRILFSGHFDVESANSL